MPEPPIDLCGLSPHQWPKLVAFMDAATGPDGVLLRHFRPDCCIGATRIAVDLLGSHLHMRIRPLVTQAEILNPALVARDRLPEDRQEYAAWQAEFGAHWISLGARDAPPRPGGWPGHLVAVLADRCLVDLSLPQANRPKHGIRLPPLVIGVDGEFLSGRERRNITVNGCLVSYQGFPSDRTFSSAPDWQRPERHKDAVRELRNRMAYHLPGRPGGRFPRPFTIAQRRTVR
jgi:hypothetical protein